MDPPAFVVVQYGGDTELETSTDQTSGVASKNPLQAEERCARKKRYCKLCNHFAASEVELAKHVETAHSVQIKTMNEKKHFRDADVECKYCGIVLTTLTTYHDHAKKKHLQQISQEWLICEDCQNYFPDQAELILHKNVSHIHAKERLPNECVFCSQTFPNEQDFHKHASLVHKDEIKDSWHSCDRCSMFFPTSIVLSRHKIQNHFHQIVGKKKVISKTELHRQRAPPLIVKPTPPVPQPQPKTRAAPVVRNTAKKSTNPLETTATKQTLGTSKTKQSSETSSTKPTSETSMTKQALPTSMNKQTSDTSMTRTTKRPLVPMMIEVQNNVHQDGVIFFKQEDRPIAAEQCIKGVAQSIAKPSKSQNEPNSSSSKRVKLTFQDSTVFNDDIVYVISDNPTHILPDVEHQGNRIMDLEMQGDCITFQVQPDST